MQGVGVDVPRAACVGCSSPVPPATQEAALAGQGGAQLGQAQDASLPADKALGPSYQLQQQERGCLPLSAYSCLISQFIENGALIVEAPQQL